MSILAEPKRKQKISIDPQNLTWKNDDQKLSKKLMEKMGWSEGDGLGRNRQGNADSVKLKANTSGRGLGADKMADYDSTWISHHDDFADLLAALNKNKEQEPEQTEEEKNAAAEKISIELKSKSIRRRIHYQKFTRAKDTSNYSDSHKKGILGYGRLKSDNAEEKIEEKTENSSVKSDSSDSQADSQEKKEGNNTVSTLSVGDYFAAKMAALKAKREAAAANQTEVKMEIKTEVEEEESDEEKARRKAEKKERKRLRREQRDKEETLETVETILEVKQEVKEEIIDEEFDEAERKRLKKEKKRLKRLREQQQPENEGAEGGEADEEEIPRKRKKHTEDEH
ncbi:G-patch domain-containing protein [Caenorhabditis elegans]|uniref:G-patch domain-containing protein n=1 Tax=Caenorhabditis elegans TaxID=6239 RepID=Q22705_CAEEL|nr:G-patch domain-containing protein [Caenorhabditis elegans]CAA92701.1 G-patch domain-containing protein [Caenorhabditis elegans]|eukprot:NP_495955.1 Uncharacterized protein CELE_T23G7.3 [Caenorhabditis elegans]